MKSGSAGGIDERGATLIEVIVAMVIFAVVVIGFAGTTVNARRTGEASRFEAEATTLAMDKLEDLRTRLPIDAQLTAGAHIDAANPLRPEGTTGGVYTRTWQITPNLPMLSMRRVEMRVSWPSQLGQRSILLVSTFSVL